MSDQKLNPNRSPPARIFLESSMESKSYSPSTPSGSTKDKDKSSKGLWKSFKSKANVFSIFEREKSPQPPHHPQPQQPLGPPPFIPLGASLNPEYENDGDYKLKNEYDRTYRRSHDDDRHKASARITIKTTEGEYDFAYRPHVTVVPPSGTYQAKDEVDYATANQSTTALSAVSHKTNADDALFDFPDLGSDLAKYIRDGTPTPTPTEEAVPVFGFIPFDEKVESYDENFELNYASPEMAPKMARTKSVRFASNDTDIEAKNAANKAAEVHLKRLELNAEQAEADRADESDENGRPRFSLPRPNFPTKTSSQETTSMIQKTRTPSPTKTLRHQASNTFTAKRSPSPRKSSLRPKENMTFRNGRNDSPVRAPHGLTSPQKTSLLQNTLISASKFDLSYISPTKSVVSNKPPHKGLSNHMRSYTPTSAEKLTAENTRANTPTSPPKLTPIRSHTPTSSSKLAPARSHKPPSPRRKLTPYSPAAEAKLSQNHSPTTTSSAKATPVRSHTLVTPITAIKLTPVHSHTPTTPTTTIKVTPIRSHTPPSATRAISSAHDSVMRGKEAHEEAARRKAIEVAELKQQNQKLLMEKRVKEDRMLREKRSEVALRRKASQGLLRDNAMNSGPASPALSRIPMTVPKAGGSRLPVLKKQESNAMMRRPGMNGPPTPTIGMARPGPQVTRPATTLAAGKPSMLKPKDSTQSLRSQTSQNQLGNKGLGVLSKPAGKSKLAQELKRAERPTLSM